MCVFYGKEISQNVAYTHIRAVELVFSYLSIEQITACAEILIDFILLEKTGLMEHCIFLITAYTR